VFDQKWLTYLLTFILILLIAIFVLSLKYQDWMIDHVKKLLIREKPPPPKPRPRGRVEKREGVVSYQLSMDMKQHTGETRINSFVTAQPFMRMRWRERRREHVSTAMERLPSHRGSDDGLWRRCG